MNRLLRFLSHLALDTLKGIGSTLLFLAGVALFNAVLFGAAWLVGNAALYWVSGSCFDLGTSTAAGILISMALAVVGIAVKALWDLAKAVRQRWRDAA